MGYRKEKKQKNQATTNLLSKLSTGWQSRYPVLLFVGGFALLMGVFYIVYLSHWFNMHIQPLILSVNASLSSRLLNLFAQNTQVISSTIYSPVFSVSIALGCDGVEAMALFSCALLAFPSKWKAKIIGLAVGISFLFILNILRVVTLFFTGVYYPRAFEVMHIEVWQVIFILLALVLWMLWLRYVVLPVNPANDAKDKANS